MNIAKKIHSDIKKLTNAFMVTILKPAVKTPNIPTPLCMVGFSRKPIALKTKKLLIAIILIVLKALCSSVYVPNGKTEASIRNTEPVSPLI